MDHSEWSAMTAEEQRIIYERTKDEMTTDPHRRPTRAQALAAVEGLDSYAFDLGLAGCRDNGSEWHEEVKQCHAEALANIIAIIDALTSDDES